MIALKRAPLRFGNFLAPNMMPVYAAMARYVSRRLGILTEMCAGTCYEAVHDQFDVCFICGLAYIELVNGVSPSIEPIAAPILQGERFGGKPVYFSDVIVRKESPVQSFADLRGRSWSYNEPFSQSGYGITRYWLAQMGETRNFFGKVVEAGWHERSIRLVCQGEVDASAIDCHVLALAMRDHPEVGRQIRVIAHLGPSTIQPVTVACHLARSLKRDLQACFVEMANDPDMKHHLDRGFIDRFVPVDDESYDDLRSMQRFCQSKGLLKL